MIQRLVVALSAMILAGCGGAAEVEGPADAGPSATPSHLGAPIDRSAEQRSQAEWMDRLVSCLREEGWTVTFTEDGFEVDTSGSTDEAFQKSEQACQARIGAYPTPAPPTDEEIERLYRLSLAAMECLEGLGEEVDPPPSLELYAQDLRSMRPPWSPYGNVRDLARVQQACPQPELGDL